MIIEDGKGSGYKVKVDETNRLHVQSINETEVEHAVESGDAYNINSGNITFTAAGTLLYFKNNEDVDAVVDAVAVGQGSGTVSDIGEVTIIRNPTGGDLISDATAVSMNQNRNFGSAKTISADAYAGKSGGTITGGDDIVLLYQAQNTRLFASLVFSVPKGQSVAIKIDPKLSSGSIKAYAALVVHLKPVSSSD
jgi:hypothetical protein